MAKLNHSLFDLKSNYLFSEIENLIKASGHKEIFNLGIGDITIPLSPYVIDAIKNASEEMKYENTLQGYGSSSGYDFLKEAIVKNDFENLNLTKEEVFITCGSKYSIANIIDLFSKDNLIGICDPTYPVYFDSNIIGGRKENIVLLPLLEENNFEPIPNQKLDIVFLCSPNNPIGTAISKKTLKKWVDFALENNSIIIFDAAYVAYIQSEDAIKSIYEIKNAKKVAIEMRSFSKTAGFTSLRCAYLVIPNRLTVKYENDNYQLNKLWNRFVSTKHGGVSYPIQKGALATFDPQGKKEVLEIINQYKENTNLLKNGLKSLNFEIFGGGDAPYIWCKTKNSLSSKAFFNLLLEHKVVCIPGSGFGSCGEGYVRFSGFTKKETINKALS